MIKFENEKIRYFDKNGVEITDGCKVKFDNGQVKKIYLTVNDELGTDATNPLWIEDGRAYECQYGIYPLTSDDTEECVVVK